MPLPILLSVIPPPLGMKGVAKRNLRTNSPHTPLPVALDDLDAATKTQSGNKQPPSSFRRRLGHSFPGQSDPFPHFFSRVSPPPNGVRDSLFSIIDLISQVFSRFRLPLTRSLALRFIFLLSAQCAIISLQLASTLRLDALLFFPES